MIPNDTSAMYNKATVLSRIGKYEEANSCYDKIISIDPIHTGALYNKRVILNKLGMHYGVIPMKQKQIL
jgi:tetratricopeptide (TPR) repeat protein